MYVTHFIVYIMTFATDTKAIVNQYDKIAKTFELMNAW